METNEWEFYNEGEEPDNLSDAVKSQNADWKKKYEEEILVSNSTIVEQVAYWRNKYEVLLKHANSLVDKGLNEIQWKEITEPENKGNE